MLKRGRMSGIWVLVLVIAVGFEHGPACLCRLGLTRVWSGIYLPMAVERGIKNIVIKTSILI